MYKIPSGLLLSQKGISAITTESPGVLRISPSDFHSRRLLEFTIRGCFVVDFRLARFGVTHSLVQLVDDIHRGGPNTIRTRPP